MQLQVQQEFFQRLKARLEPQASLAVEIAEILDISSDSAYRRIRGETDLSFEEATKLAARFRVSLDSFLPADHGRTVSFRVDDLGAGVDMLEAQLRGLVELLTEIARTPEARIDYFSPEFPLFHHLQLPGVCAFKVFYWQKMAVETPEDDPGLFAIDAMPRRLRESCAELLNLYIKIPSVEILSDDAITSTLKQVIFFLESGYFEKPEEALVILDELAQSVDHLKEEATLGYKFRYGARPVGQAGNLKLYHNEIVLAGNMAMVSHAGGAQVFIEHNILDFMQTDNPFFSEYSKKNIDKILTKSVMISTVSEKERNKFFNRLQQQIRKIRQQAELLI